MFILFKLWKKSSDVVFWLSDLQFISDNPIARAQVYNTQLPRESKEAAVLQQTVEVQKSNDSTAEWPIGVDLEKFEIAAELKTYTDAAMDAGCLSGIFPHFNTASIDVTFSPTRAVSCFYGADWCTTLASSSPSESTTPVADASDHRGLFTNETGSIGDRWQCDITIQGV